LSLAAHMAPDRPAARRPVRPYVRRTASSPAHDSCVVDIAHNGAARLCNPRPGLLASSVGTLPTTSQILVGNKSDMADERRAVPYARGKALADEYGIAFFETSAKDNSNVEEVMRRGAWSGGAHMLGPLQGCRPSQGLGRGACNKAMACEVASPPRRTHESFLSQRSPAGCNS
jgi:hypothetical protein